jgi:hypothetical protein
MPHSLKNIKQKDMATFPTKSIRLIVKCNILQPKGIVCKMQHFNTSVTTDNLISNE